MNKSDKTRNSFFSKPRNNHEYDQNQLFLFSEIQLKHQEIKFSDKVHLTAADSQFLPLI